MQPLNRNCSALVIEGPVRKTWCDYWERLLLLTERPDDEEHNGGAEQRDQ